MQRFSAITTRAVSDERLTDSEYRTLGAIAAHADKNGWCYPSQRRLAEIRGVTRQTINAHTKKLEALEYLNVHHRRRDDGGQTSNLYQVRLDFPYEEGDKADPPVKPGFDRGCKTKDLTGGVKPGFDTNNTTEETPQNNSSSAGPVFARYEQMFGALTPVTSEKVGDAIDDYGEEKVLAAMDEAEPHNPYSWRYVEQILERWSRKGQQTDKHALLEKVVKPWSTGRLRWGEIPNDHQGLLRAMSPHGPENLKRMTEKQVEIAYYQALKQQAVPA